MFVVTFETTNRRISEIFKIICHKIKVRQVKQVKLHYSVKLNTAFVKKKGWSRFCVRVAKKQPK